MSLWRTRCPVPPREQSWIDESLDWLVAQFGHERLMGEVVTPSDQYFPGVYAGTRDDVRGVLDRLCAHMGIDPSRAELEYDEDEPGLLEGGVPVVERTGGAAGHYRPHGDGCIIAVRGDQAHRPMALVATIAHELGHLVLLGEGRIAADRSDGEPLTDLATVYFGLGIFGANAAFDYERRTDGDYVRTRTSRLGYLPETAWGYALARYAWMRGELEPGWARYLDTNPGTYLERGLRFLCETAEDGKAGEHTAPRA
jgi:hypothetical protein